MSHKAYTKLGRKHTPQSQPIPGSAQAPNNAGGYTWQVDDWQRLERFLILGSEGGTYYVSEAALTRQNAGAVERCIQQDGPRVVHTLLQVSDSGRAARNDPALLALALCCSIGDAPTRKAALAALPAVARTGTHLFHFAAYCDSLRGWGRGLREAVARWYNLKPAADLAYQAVKYRQRDGWSHRDLLRLAHPAAPGPQHNAIYHWITQGKLGPHTPALIEAFCRLQATTEASQAAALITQFNLPREAVPTQLLDEPLVWEALLESMPLTATLRSLGKMGAVGLLQPGSAAARVVIERVSRLETLARAREHPMGILLARLTYQQGQGVRGSLSWQPAPEVVEALEAAFYLSFNTVQPTGRRTVLAVDASGSMDETLSAFPISCRDAALAMALVTAHVEPNYTILAYTCNGEVVELPIQPGYTLEQAVTILREKISYGGTDCSLPLAWMNSSREAYDVLVQYTDNETWAGDIHPQQALEAYRRRVQRPVKAVVVGMVANDAVIADPDDGGTLGVAGFDASVPAVIADFCRQP